MSTHQNRRAFLGGLFGILPAATCYKRIWKEIAKTELDQIAIINPIRPIETTDKVFPGWILVGGPEYIRWRKLGEFVDARGDFNFK